MLTFSQVKKNSQVLEFIKATEDAAEKLRYTDHGLRHCNLVADRARTIALEIGLDKKEQELAAIAGFCHDMGMFLGRTQHHYWGALLFSQVFLGKAQTNDLITIMQALVNHDKEDVVILNKISAILILADKADVQRGRVIEKNMEKIKEDIHDRVNYAVEEVKLRFSSPSETPQGGNLPKRQVVSRGEPSGIPQEGNFAKGEIIPRGKKEIILKLKIDANFVPVIEYFEIFTTRMAYCRSAAHYLGYKFGLEINNFKLL